MSKKAKQLSLNIYLISDSTGELGERFTNAIISQFPQNKIELTKFSYVETKEDLLSAFQKINTTRSALFHTVVSKELKRVIRKECQKKKIPEFDLTGPPSDFLVKHFKLKPVWNPKALHQFNAEYQKRVSAIEFTTNHDDGLSKDALKNADIILVGPSRTSKTPTSIYLAIKGYRVANIPITPIVGVDSAFNDLKSDPRVFGLMIEAEKLQEVRKRREKELGTSVPGYTDLEEIYKEIEWAKKLYRQFDWKTIDVTKRAIEETSAQIMRMVYAK